MTSEEAYRRCLQEVRPCGRNMWKLYDRTAQNLEFRGIRLTYQEWEELENDYYDFVLAGKPLIKR